jgi:CheY-like chemotaxis protein
MSTDLVSVQILAAFGTPAEREMLRQAASLATVPVELTEADIGDGAKLLASKEFDIALVDAIAPPTTLAGFVSAAKAARKPPFVILVASAAWEAGEFKAGGVAADGVISKPTRAEQAKVLIDRCVRLRLPSRVLVVDDSATMRSIVRKLLAGTRFATNVAEAEEGIDALKQIASGKFDIVFLDYNMPGLNGVETLSEIKRQYPRVKVVIMTSNTDERIAEKARAAGAAAFLRKPFYPADIDAVLCGLHGLGM